MYHRPLYIRPLLWPIFDPDRLENAGIGDTGACSIAKALLRNSTLTTLRSVLACLPVPACFPVNE
jgi:hypothetical protein